MNAKKLAAAFCVCLWLGLPGYAAEESFRGIEHIRGDVYQIQDNNNTFSAFLLTPEGIILTDPMDSETAAWLKAELAERFDVPVKYVIYSNGIEHNGGAEVYEDAIIIAHENVIAAFIRDENPAVRPHLTFSDRMTITLGGLLAQRVECGAIAQHDHHAGRLAGVLRRGGDRDVDLQR